jgi:dTDP-glucose 4,6-dehydratase
LITGGAGFIGSNLVRAIIQTTNHCVTNVDNLSYAGNLESLADIEGDARYQFEQLNIADSNAVDFAFKKHMPDVVVNLAAESHVDRSIDSPASFIQTNIVGTYNLLESAKLHWQTLPDDGQKNFRFHHVSTDEVYGSLTANDPAFNEQTRYAPRSPYSATKASSDHLVRAWSNTYGLPVLISSCSNNYGPFQFPEKLIPNVTLKAIHGMPIQVYGNGTNVRDWIYVDDHVEALIRILNAGKPGETYNVGGGNAKSNIEVVKSVCRILDRLFPIDENSKLQSRKDPVSKYEDLIEFVTDRPGHDFRYASDISKIGNELNWKPTVDFDNGLEKTVKWYLANTAWWLPSFSKKQQPNWLGLPGSEASVN